MTQPRRGSRPAPAARARRRRAGRRRRAAAGSAAGPSAAGRGPGRPRRPGCVQARRSRRARAHRAGERERRGTPRTSMREQASCGAGRVAVRAWTAAGCWSASRSWPTARSERGAQRRASPSARAALGSDARRAAGRAGQHGQALDGRCGGGGERGTACAASGRSRGADRCAAPTATADRPAQPPRRRRAAGARAGAPTAGLRRPLGVLRPTCDWRLRIKSITQRPATRRRRRRAARGRAAPGRVAARDRPGAARFGGEEFLVLLRGNSTAPGWRAVAEEAARGGRGAHREQVGTDHEREAWAAPWRGRQARS